ncbi:MAG: alpha-glucan phosphorylase, partial [Bacteroidetes bacterium]|nr:alpha-glucan phosphorylase [Bacteroidota bacterium]
MDSEHQNSNNYYEVADAIKESIISFSSKTEEEIEHIRHRAAVTAEHALWKHFIKYYYKAYDIPVWNEITVKSRIPEELKKLSEIAHNIWWSWDSEAVILFRDLDPVLWKEVGLNPVTLLERMSFEKLEALSNDKVIIKRMNDLYARFKEYVDVKPDTNRPSVAYF